MKYVPTRKDTVGSMIKQKDKYIKYLYVNE